MAKAFWLFARNDGNGAPALPAGVGGRFTNPGDIITLTGEGHQHLLLGGYAMPDDNLNGQTGDGHSHLVVQLANGNWAQVTRGAAAHTHTLPTDANGNLSPDWFLLFWAGSDADAATINADPNCFPVVEAEITTDGEGNAAIGALDNTPWTTAERTLWEARMLNVLGFELPAEVDRGKRLIQVFVGALLARAGDERGLRFGS